MSKFLLPYFCLLGCLGMFSSGCIVEINGDSDDIRGQGPLAQEFREIEEISGVQLAMDGDLSIEPGPEVEFRVEAQENLLFYIRTFVRNGELVIESDPDVSLRPSEPIRFVLVTPSLEAISLAGSGDIQAGSFESPAFFVSVAGSGDLNLRELLTDNLEVSIAGSGDVNIAGTAAQQEISIAGSGDYNGRDMASNVVAISIAGSGDGYIQVSDELTASLIGSGSVFYVGNPSITSSIVGSGRVRQLDN